MGNPRVKKCIQCKHHCTFMHNNAYHHYCKKKEEYCAPYETVKFYFDLRCKYFKEDENFKEDDE